MHVFEYSCEASERETENPNSMIDGLDDLEIRLGRSSAVRINGCWVRNGFGIGDFTFSCRVTDTEREHARVKLSLRSSFFPYGIQARTPRDIARPSINCICFLARSCFDRRDPIPRY